MNLDEVDTTDPYSLGHIGPSPHREGNLQISNCAIMAVVSNLVAHFVSALLCLIVVLFLKLGSMPALTSALAFFLCQYCLLPNLLYTPSDFVIYMQVTCFQLERAHKGLECGLINSGNSPHFASFFTNHASVDHSRPSLYPAHSAIMRFLFCLLSNPIRETLTACRDVQHRFQIGINRVFIRSAGERRHNTTAAPFCAQQCPSSSSTMKYTTKMAF